MYVGCILDKYYDKNIQKMQTFFIQHDINGEQTTDYEMIFTHSQEVALYREVSPFLLPIMALAFRRSSIRPKEKYRRDGCGSWNVKSNMSESECVQNVWENDLSRSWLPTTDGTNWLSCNDQRWPLFAASMRVPTTFIDQPHLVERPLVYHGYKLQNALQGINHVTFSLWRKHEKWKVSRIDI